jgi:hypothetical protein
MSASVFRPGLALAQAFYADVVAPLVAFPHTACLLGEGSEVLGFDSARSTDHEWGPRVQLFVAADYVDQVRRAVAQGLPAEYDGYPTVWYSLASNTVAHHIEVTTFDEWIVAQLGFDPRRGIDHAAWLGLAQQRLLYVTRGGRVQGRRRRTHAGEVRACLVSNRCMAVAIGEPVAPDWSGSALPSPSWRRQSS